MKTAVKAQLANLPDEPDFWAKLEEFYRKFPLPEPTGEKADKAFFDDLSGEFD